MFISDETPTDNQIEQMAAILQHTMLAMASGSPIPALLFALISSYYQVTLDIVTELVEKDEITRANQMKQDALMAIDTVKEELEKDLENVLKGKYNVDIKTN